ncbi:phage holin family protein [Patescibacteria group bacterium]|nr:phage holin family protein [Patescibacteria group bacterium]
MRFILRLLLNAAGILFVAYIIPGLEVSSFIAALLFALILGIVNALLRPLILLLTLPVNILTLGLFTLVVNAFTFWLASVVSFGVHVESFAAAIWGGLIVWIITAITGLLLKDGNEE